MHTNINTLYISFSLRYMYIAWASCVKWIGFCRYALTYTAETHVKHVHINRARRNDTDRQLCAYAIRLESSTQVSKKRHRRPSHRQLSRTLSNSESTKMRHDTSLEFPISTDIGITTDANKYTDHTYTDSVKETSTVQPKMSTRGLSSRRHHRRCHHRRR